MGKSFPFRHPWGQRYNPETKKMDSPESKDIGFFGPLKNREDDVASEYSFSAPILGKEREIPSFVPSLSPNQLRTARTAAMMEQELPEDIYDVAIKHAEKRISEGKNPYWDPKVDPYPKWSPEQDWPKPVGMAHGGVSKRNKSMAKSPAWTRKEGKNPEGGLNEKGRASLRAAGHDIKRPQPEGGSRKDSFCARMKGMKEKLTSSETANDPDSRINKSLRKWKCRADGGPLMSDAESARQRLIEEILRKNKLSKTPASKQSATTPYKPSSATPSVSKEEYMKGILGGGSYALAYGGRARRKGYATGGDALDQSNPYLEEINSLYKDIFGRQSDTGGANYWANQLATTNLSLGDLQNLFLATDEAKNRAPDLVKQLYQENLGRLPSDERINFWSNELKKDPNWYSGLVDLMASSNEGKLNQLYKDELGRAIDPGGREYWLNQINSGKTSFSDLANVLSGSEEAKNYRANVMSDATRGAPKFSDPAEALAQVMWSEGDLFRGKPNAEKELAGIGWTVRNRADAGFTENMPKWYRASHDPNSIIDQITAPNAYTGFNSSRQKMASEAFEKNPEIKKYYTDLANKILTGQIDDPTQGSISYYNPKVVKTPGFAAKKGLNEGFYKTTTLDADPKGQYHVYYGHNKYTPIALARQYAQGTRTSLPSTPGAPAGTPTPIVSPPPGTPPNVGEGLAGQGAGGNVAGNTGMGATGGVQPIPTPPPVGTSWTPSGGADIAKMQQDAAAAIAAALAAGAVNPYIVQGATGTSTGGWNPTTGTWNNTGGYGTSGGNYGYTSGTAGYGTVGGISAGGYATPGYKKGGAVKGAMDVARAYKKGGPVWDKPRPKSLGKPTPLSSDQKSSAKAMAKAAGRPYPNLVDNLRAAKKS